VADVGEVGDEGIARETILLVGPKGGRAGLLESLAEAADGGEEATGCDGIVWHR